jgi:hypothetical protein
MTAQRTAINSHTRIPNTHPSISLSPLRPTWVGPGREVQDRPEPGGTKSRTWPGPYCARPGRATPHTALLPHDLATAWSAYMTGGPVHLTTPQ